MDEKPFKIISIVGGGPGAAGGVIQYGTVEQASTQTHVLADAINYAFIVRDRGDDGLVWLDEWRHGDAEAMAELTEWRRLNSHTA
jgi:hypothetical protein